MTYSSQGPIHTNPQDPFDVLGEKHGALLGYVSSGYLEYDDNNQLIPTVQMSCLSTPHAAYQIGSVLNVGGVAGLDSIFAPFTNASSHNLLPHFETPTNLTDPNSLILDPFNPNSIFSTGNTQAQNNDIFFNSGHNIGLANTFTDTGYGTSGDLDFKVDLHDQNSFSFTGVRSVALKGPLIMTGWGFKEDGNPVPSDDGDETKFASDAFRNPNKWKTGPVDLRWDDARKVWTVGGSTTISLVKVTNTFNPACFSYEVDRSNTRAQYARNSPSNMITFTDSDSAIYDPEQVAYDANSNNAGCTEQLNYDSIDFPHYEAFIIRQTADVVGNEYYNIWTQDCQDCGTVNNQCALGSFPRHGSTGALIQNKKILIENPLNQAMDVGDLAFTVDTGRKRKVNTGQFSGGSGTSASGNITTDSNGNAVFGVTNGGSGYSNGGFGIIFSGAICVNLDLTFSAGALSAGTLSPTSGFDHDKTYPVTIYPSDATANTESLSIHWIMQAEFKSQQVVTHVECDGGLLQNCTTKIQTQGFKSCEYCGEDTTLVNSF